MQLVMGKKEIDSAVQVYLEALGFSRNDFTVGTKIVAGRSGNDGKLEVTLMPKMEPSLDKVTTEVQPSEQLETYAEVHNDTEAENDEIVEDDEIIEEAEDVAEPEYYGEAKEESADEVKTPVLNQIEEDEEF